MLIMLLLFNKFIMFIIFIMFIMLNLTIFIQNKVIKLSLSKIL